MVPKRVACLCPISLCVHTVLTAQGFVVDAVDLDALWEQGQARGLELKFPPNLNLLDVTRNKSTITLETFACTNPEDSGKMVVTIENSYPITRGIVQILVASGGQVIAGMRCFDRFYNCSSDVLRKAWNILQPAHDVTAPNESGLAITDGYHEERVRIDGTLLTVSSGRSSPSTGHERHFVALLCDSQWFAFGLNKSGRLALKKCEQWLLEIGATLAKETHVSPNVRDRLIKQYGL